MTVTVTFEYDESERKWEVYVAGCKDEQEAIHAFNAVIVACKSASPSMMHKAIVQSDGITYKMSVARHSLS